MTPPADKVTILMTLTRQLTQVLDAETEALRRLRLTDLGDLQAEKQALADVYETEFSELRRNPDVLGSVAAHLRDELEQETRRFQEATRRNGLALQAAKTVVERALQIIGQSAHATPSYEASGAGPRTAQILPFAIDRTC